MSRALLLALPLALAAPAAAGQLVHQGIVSGGGAPMTQSVPLPAFDTQGGTRRLDQVTLDFLTSTIGGGTSNGSGIPSRVYSRLDANWSRASTPLANTQALVDTLIGNSGPPGSFTVFNTDTAQVVLTLPDELALYLGLGTVDHEVFTQLDFFDDPLGSVSFSAGGSVRWTLTYDFSLLDGAFCPGDGTEGACPCGNSGLAGRGCDNAQGTGGVALSVFAFTPDGTGGGTAQLDGAGFPPAATPAVVAIRSPARAEPPLVFGDGLRCIAASGLVRVGSSVASGGAAQIALVHGAGAGSFVYQLWYRSNPAAFCDPSAGFNLSNGWQLTW